MGKARYKTFAETALTPNKVVPIADAAAKDAFTNPAARMGFGTASVAEDVDYTLVRWSLNYWLMITLFRNHWLARKIVEIPAKDMCKAWPRLMCSLSPTEINKFDRTVERTLTPQRIKRALTWANLFGGAGALMVIAGHENILDEPLDLDAVSPGSYKGLIVFDRWSGISPKGTTAVDVENPMTFGMPEYYTVYGNRYESLFDVHASRILRFTGPEVPSPEYEASQYWGISKLELVFEELRKRDNASWSILQLMFRAQILTQVNPELAQLLSGLGGGSAQAAQQFYRTMQAQNELLSNNSMLVLGKDGKLESHQYSFSGISDVLDRFEVSVSGSAGIPYSKLFGRNSSQLGQINEADERNYEESTAQAQHDELKPPLHNQLYPVICMSEFGEVPEDLDFTFPSIRVLTEKEKAELCKTGTDAIIGPFSAGVTSQRTTMMELKALADNTGIWTNITAKDIAKANDIIELPLDVQKMAATGGILIDPQTGELIKIDPEGDGDGEGKEESEDKPKPKKKAKE